MTDKKEELKEIHQEVITFMSDRGYGLLTDGDTFYQKGMELEPRNGITFTMTQAYAIKNFLIQTTPVDRESDKTRPTGTQSVDVENSIRLQTVKDFVKWYNTPRKRGIALVEIPFFLKDVYNISNWDKLRPTKESSGGEE